MTISLLMIFRVSERCCNQKGPREGWDAAISAYPIKMNGYNDYFDAAKELCDKFIIGEVKI